MNLDSLDTETRVYMSPEEVQSLIAAAETRERALAIRTMWWAAARSKTVATRFYRRNLLMQDGEIPIVRFEVKDSNPDHDGSTQPSRRVIPGPLWQDLQQWCDDDGRGPDNHVFSVQEGQMQNWVKDAAATAAKETGDPDFRLVTSHDLRRSAANAMYWCGLGKEFIKNHGDWSDMDTLSPYLTAPPLNRMQERMERVGWLEQNGQSSHDQFTRIEEQGDRIIKALKTLGDEIGVDLGIPDSPRDQVGAGETASRRTHLGEFTDGRPPGR